MTTPFVAFETPDPAPTARPEVLAMGLALGAVVGSILPAAALLAELVAAGSVAALAPSASLLVTLLAPALAGIAGAWGMAVLSAHREGYDLIAEKAGSLMDESWELQQQVDILESAPPLRDMRQDELPPDAWPAPAVPRLIEERQSSTDEEALIQAQAQLLHSIGSAARDASRRMQVSLRGLQFTPMSVVQERLVQALSGHLHALRDLADDVVQYAEEEPEPPRQVRTGRARAAA